MQLPILHVHVRDPIVMLLEKRNRRGVVARHEMAEVEVRAIVRRVGERLLPHRRSHGRVAVVADHDAVRVGDLAEALRVDVLRRDRQFARQRAGAEASLSARSSSRGCRPAGSGLIQSNLTISIATPASSYCCLNSLTLLIGADNRHWRSSSAAAFCAACCSGACAPRAPAPRASAARGGDPRNCSTGCDPQLDATDAQLQAAAEHLVAAHVVGAEVVGDVHADLHAGPLRIRLVGEPRARAGAGLEQPPRRRHGRQSQFAEVASRQSHPELLWAWGAASTLTEARRPAKRARRDPAGDLRYLNSFRPHALLGGPLTESERVVEISGGRPLSDGGSRRRSRRPVVAGQPARGRPVCSACPRPRRRFRQPTR